VTAGQPPNPTAKAKAKQAVESASSAPTAPAGPVAQCPLPKPPPAGPAAAEQAAIAQELGKLKPEDVAVIREGLKNLDAGTRPPELHPSGKWGGSKGTYKNKSQPFLPKTDASGTPITYKEYYLPKDPSDPTFHGSRRMLQGSDGSVHYTNDHYKSFTKVR